MQAKTTGVYIPDEITNSLRDFPNSCPEATDPSLLSVQLAQLASVCSSWATQ